MESLYNICLRFIYHRGIRHSHHVPDEVNCDLLKLEEETRLEKIARYKYMSDVCDFNLSLEEVVYDMSKSVEIYDEDTTCDIYNKKLRRIKRRKPKKKKNSIYRVHCEFIYEWAWI
jgi:hypothetical protein